LAAGLGTVLVAAAALAAYDAVHTGGGLAYLPALLGLWALVALPIGLFAGLVLGAGNAMWGAGWVLGLAARLRADRALDRSVAGGVIAAALVGGAYAGGVGLLAVGLVADVQRQLVGGMLVGGAAVLALPLAVLGALPVYRAARVAAWAVPRLGPLPRTLFLLAGGAGGTVGLGVYVVYRMLDHEALNLASLALPALVPVAAAALGTLWYGALTPVREALPGRGVLTAAAALAATALVPAALRAPTDEVRDAILERSYIGPQLVGLLRRALDRDGDGFSAFFGGPDCSDRDPAVSPAAKEIPGDGIDNNCAGGDAAPEPAAPAGPASQVPPPSPAPPSAAAPAIGGKNVLIVFVDTLRYDRLGFAGYRRDGASLTPQIDAFARQAVVFRRAFAQAPNTPRSVPSFLASRYPSQLAVDDPRRDYMTLRDEGNDFLFEVLRRAGFRTIGSSSHFYFCDRKRDPSACPGVGEWMRPNVLQGADEWDNDGALSIAESNTDTASPRIVAKSIRRLDALAREGTRFAMLVHLFEPHGEYMAREGFPPVTETTASGKLSRRYDYEVAVEDRHVGELLSALDRNGLAATTTVVLISDHGEAFGVHRFAGQRMFYHGQTLYRELLHVPLMLRVPGAAPRVVDEVVQLLDLAPTVAALFGVAPAASWQGRSLVPAITGGALPPRPAYAELLPARSWNHAARSLITADGSRHLLLVLPRRWELYDLERDPDETRDLAERDPALEDLKRQLMSWIEGGT
jgi:hypothetical protein